MVQDEKANQQVNIDADQDDKLKTTYSGSTLTMDNSGCGC